MAKQDAGGSGQRQRQRRRASIEQAVDPGLAEFTAKLNRLAEAQRLLVVAGDGARPLDVRLSAFDEYCRRFDQSAAEKLRAMIESGGAVQH